MVKYRIAVAILMLAISSNLVACKSDNSKQESIDTTQESSSEIQGDILSTSGNFTKLLIVPNSGASTNSSYNSENEEKLDSIEGTEAPSNPNLNSRPPIGLAVIDSNDRVNLEENKISGSVEYDTFNISEFLDCEEAEAADAVDGFTVSVQSTLVKFDQNASIVAGYLKSICDMYRIDTNTVESERGLKVDESLQYNIIVARNDRYNIYLAINVVDYTAKFSIKER